MVADYHTVAHGSRDIVLLQMGERNTGGQPVMAEKRKLKKRTDRQRANDLEREYYSGAAKEAQPKWQDVHKEIYGSTKDASK